MKYDTILKIKNCVLVYTGVILFVLPVLSTESIIYQTCKKTAWKAWWPSGRASDSRARGQGFNLHSGRHVLSLSKTHLPHKSTGNSKEAVSLS